MTTQTTFLVTGALGCLGAWSIYHLLRQGEKVVSFDIGDSSHRLDMLMSAEEQASVTFVRGDLADPEQVLNVFKTHKITHVLHLAALQVPFCRANPILGAQVNVVGTINVFEAARQTQVPHVVYASSVAVYGPPEEYPPAPIGDDAPFAPRTLYGTYKQANEAAAKVYWQDHQLSSTALRPHTVYGIGRDQGLTSDPTKAMLAAVVGKPFQINFSSKIQFQWASDVALQFIEAACKPLQGAYGFNLGGDIISIPEIIAHIKRAKPDADIAYSDRTLPFPEGFDESEFRKSFPSAPYTPLETGIEQTIMHFARCAREERFKSVLTL